MIPIAKPRIPAHHADAVQTAVATGNLTTGVLVERFERQIEEMVGGNRRAFATSSGTMALVAALKLLPVNWSLPIAIPAYGFVGIANAVVMALGRMPRFHLVDVDFETGRMKLPALEEALRQGVGAVVWVAFNGGVPKPDELIYMLVEACRYRAIVINDSACCMGHSIEIDDPPDIISKHGAAFGDASILSFSTPKLVTCGQGGMLLMNKKSELSANPDEFLHQGREPLSHDPLIARPGTNGRMTDMAAALGMAQLADIEEATRAKAMMHSALREAWPDMMATASGVPNYNIAITNGWEQTEALIVYLIEHNIVARQLHAPLWMHPAYMKVGPEPRQSFDGTSWLWDRAVYLPAGAGYKEDEIAQIADALASFRKA